MPDFFSSRADVATDEPERYRTQLVSHIGTRATVETDGDTSTFSFDAGQGVVIVGEGGLELHVTAPDLEGLERVQQVLGGHLKRFSQRHQLAVEWIEGD